MHSSHVEAYEAVIATSNEAFHKYHHNELPAVMQKLQSLEEMRIHSLTNAINSFIKIYITFVATLHQLIHEMNELTSQASVDTQIKSFIADCIHLYGPPLDPQPFAYDLAVTAAELRAEIAAADNHQQTPLPNKPASLFYSSLEQIIAYEQSVMADQPPLDVPRIVPTLISALVNCGGLDAEGIFRLSVSSDELHALRKRMESGDYSMNNVTNPHLPAALLKALLRDLSDPLTPFELYDKCIAIGHISTIGHPDAVEAVSAVVNAMPILNRRVLYHLLSLLSLLLSYDHIENTRMNLNNIGIVFAPSLLRSSTNDPVTMMKDSKYASGYVCQLLHSFIHDEHDDAVTVWSQLEGVDVDCGQRIRDLR